MPRIIPYAFLILLCLTKIVQADDDTSVDKSSYTLFNPVPDDLMGNISTDRPTKSNSPSTVDAGHFQYEADIVNWTYDHYNASQKTTSDLLIASPTFKVGLSENTDIEVQFSPFNYISTTSRASGSNSSAVGIGDVYTRFKYNILGNEGGDYALAIVPYVKAPSAPHNIGNSHWEGGGYMPFTITLPSDWLLTLQTELDRLENNNLDGMHNNYQNLINVGHPIFSDDVTGYIEFWSDVNNDVNSPTQYTLDLAYAWLLDRNLQFDGGVNIGLNKAAPDVQPYLGISQRF